MNLDASRTFLVGRCGGSEKSWAHSGERGAQHAERPSGWLLSAPCVSRPGVPQHAHRSGARVRRGLLDQGRGTKPAARVRSGTTLCAGAFAACSAGPRRGRGRGGGGVRGKAGAWPQRLCVMGRASSTWYPTDKFPADFLVGLGGHLCLSLPAPTLSPESRPGGSRGPPCRPHPPRPWQLLSFCDQRPLWQDLVPKLSESQHLTWVVYGSSEW